jgi:hypothetical protein
MKKYIVIALSVGANSNKVFHAKDIVNEDAFDIGRAEELVKQGFLEPYDEVVITLDKDDLVNNPDLMGIGSNVGNEVIIPVIDPNSIVEPLEDVTILVTEPAPNAEPSEENDLSKLVGEASGSNVVNEDEFKAEGKASKPKK